MIWGKQVQFAASAGNLTLFCSCYQRERSDRCDYSPDNATTTEPLRFGSTKLHSNQHAALGPFTYGYVSPWSHALVLSISDFPSNTGAPMAGLGPKILEWNAQLATSALAFSVENTDTSTLASISTRPVVRRRILFVQTRYSLLGTRSQASSTTPHTTTSPILTLSEAAYGKTTFIRRVTCTFVSQTTLLDI